MAHRFLATVRLILKLNFVFIWSRFAKHELDKTKIDSIWLHLTSFIGAKLESNIDEELINAANMLLFCICSAGLVWTYCVVSPGLVSYWRIQIFLDKMWLQWNDTLNWFRKENLLTVISLLLITYYSLFMTHNLRDTIYHEPNESLYKHFKDTNCTVVDSFIHGESDCIVTSLAHRGCMRNILRYLYRIN